MRIWSAITSPFPRATMNEANWVFCDRCGTWVDTDSIHPDVHCYAGDSDFYFVDCWVKELQMGSKRTHHDTGARYRTLSTCTQLGVRTP